MSVKKRENARQVNYFKFNLHSLILFLKIYILKRKEYSRFLFRFRHAHSVGEQIDKKME